MKIAASRQGVKPAGKVLLPALFVAMISFFGVSLQPLSAQEVAIDTLLPPDTLVYSYTENAVLASEQFATMPFYKILAEKEVVDFLEKPKKFVLDALGKLKEEAAKDEAIKSLDLDFEKFKGVEMGQCFFALTHVTLPETFGPEDPASMIPDVGLVFGIEFLNPEKNLIDYCKNTLVAFATAKGFPVQLEASEYKGVAFEKVILPLPFPVATPCFFKIGNIDVFSTSESSMREILDRYTGSEQPSLAGCDGYAKGMKQVDFNDPAATVEYVNASALSSLLEAGIVYLYKAKQMSEGMAEEKPVAEMDDIERLLHNFPEKLAKILDLSGVRNMGAVCASRVSRDGLATSYEYTSFSGPRNGFLALSPNVPITEEKLKMIPQDAITLGIGHFDMAGLYDLIMEGIKLFDEQTHSKVQGGLSWFSSAIAGEEGGAGIDIRNDILGSLGTEFISYTLKAKGMAMMGTPPVFFYVDVKDYGRFSGAVKKLFDGIENISPEAAQAISFNTIDYEGHEICYLKFNQMPLPLQPSFTNVGDYVVFSLDAKELKRLIKKFGKNEKSILDNEDFLSHYNRLPRDKEIYSIAYANVAENFGSTYETITPMIPMLTMALPPEIDLPVDFMLLPTSECITKHLFSSLSASYKEGDGVIAVSYGPFGTEVTQVVVPAIVGGVVGGALMFGTTAQRSEAMAAELETAQGVGGRFADSAEAENPTIETKKMMGALAGACMVYNIENGSYPASLDELLKPTDAYPDGFYPPKKLPVDPWGNAFKYKKFTDGKRKYMIWSCGPNGACDAGEGDDIVKLK